MASGDIELQGVDELLSKFDAIPERVAKNVMAGALRAGATVIADQARQNLLTITAGHASALSRWEDKHPGLLLRSILVRSSRRVTEIVARVGIAKAAFYGRFVEFGHPLVRRGKTGKRSIGQVPAYPFMRPAFDVKASAATDAIVDYASKRLEKEIAS